MTTGLVDWVEEQLNESGVDDEVGLLILAAMEGDDQLDEYIADGHRRPGPRGAAAQIPAVAKGTFLSYIDVEGFRGVGDNARLTLRPQPGLTIVAGRNGSGKSSLAEALEVVLTGETYRWRDKKSVMWSKNWRNLHHDKARIRVGLVEEGSGAVQVAASWADGEPELDAHEISVQRTIEGKLAPANDDFGSLGWEHPLEQFRPLLSYDELGGLLGEGPSKLYDALASILGVEQLTDALTRIQARLKIRIAPKTALTARRKSLRSAAMKLSDTRAAQASALLAKNSPDTATLVALATGGQPAPDGPISALRQLASVFFPSTIEVAHAVAEQLRAAVVAVADSADDATRSTHVQLKLLQDAVRAHADHGDMPCPVCQGRTLDAEWEATGRERAELLKQELASYDAARRTVEEAVEAWQRLLTPRPNSLSTAPLPQLEAVVGKARDAWDAVLSTQPTAENAALLTGSTHLEQWVPVLVETLATLRQEASDELLKLDDAWRPLALNIASWSLEWDDMVAGQPIVERLSQAEKWLKDHDRTLKNERLRPIAEGAKRAWSKLRQESNVDLGELTLEGSKTQRRVQIGATVDGADAGGISVLSQGELHALALSLFIPRATMAESPFRFLVLDDPVQAMDPAKVDGLVELLNELAQDRQVIVLSHDDRLPAAVRRSAIDATVLEVTRGKDSSVSIRVATDPSARYIGDAFGLVKEFEAQRLSGDAARRALPGLLRFATESAAKDRFFRESIGQGRSITETESAWQAADSTRERLALTLFGDHEAHQQLDAWAAAPHRRYGLRHVGTAVHQGLRPDVDPRIAAQDVQRLIADVR